jgi:hypothetical protein
MEGDCWVIYFVWFGFCFSGLKESLIVISDWVIEVADCSKFLVDFFWVYVGLAEYGQMASWSVALFWLWPNGRRGDYGVWVLFLWFG